MEEAVEFIDIHQSGQIAPETSPTTTSFDLARTYAPQLLATMLASLVNQEDIVDIALIFQISEVFKGYPCGGIDG